MIALTYFAHSKLDYGTTRERKVRTAVERKWGSVTCPHRDMGELGSIEPYLTQVLRSKRVVVLEHGGFVGRGVFCEVLHAINHRIPVLVYRSRKWFKVRGAEIADSYDWRFKYAKLML